MTTATANPKPKGAKAPLLNTCRVCATPPVVESDNRRMVAGFEYYCKIRCPNHVRECVSAVSLDSEIDAQHDAEELWNKHTMEGIDPATGKRDWKETCRLCEEGEIEPEFCSYYGEPNGCNAPRGEHPSLEAV